jgi:hypothetical protein
MQILLVQSKTLVAVNQWMDNIVIIFVINNTDDDDDDDDDDDVDAMLSGHLLNHSGLKHPEVS